MIIGITGTREGMTEYQKNRVIAYLGYLQLVSNLRYISHGDCIGVDEQVHNIARGLRLKTIIHPPEDPKYRAFCRGDVVYKEKPYLIRNKDIVNECRELIVIPKESEEQQRSGTWSTKRYAQQTGRPFRIIYPN